MCVSVLLTYLSAWKWNKIYDTSLFFTAVKITCVVTDHHFITCSNKSTLLLFHRVCEIWGT